MKRKTAICACIAALSGCATSSVSYTPPSEPSISNAKIVGQPFNVVWDRLVKDLGGNFFMIENVDKASRRIEVSLSSQSPSHYVDCGQSSRMFHYQGPDQFFDYPAASSSTFQAASKKGEVLTVTRTSKLNARSTISVTPQGTETRVAVDTKYMLNIAVAVTNAQGSRVKTENLVYDFSTNKPYIGKDQTVCYSNGAIESKILGPGFF